MTVAAGVCWWMANKHWWNGDEAWWKADKAEWEAEHAGDIHVHGHWQDEMKDDYMDWEYKPRGKVKSWKYDAHEEYDNNNWWDEKKKEEESWKDCEWWDHSQKGWWDDKSCDKQQSWAKWDDKQSCDKQQSCGKWDQQSWGKWDQQSWDLDKKDDQQWSKQSREWVDQNPQECDEQWHDSSSSGTTHRRALESNEGPTQKKPKWSGKIYPPQPTEPKYIEITTRINEWFQRERAGSLSNTPPHIKKLQCIK